MLTQSFCHVPGIGEITERSLWRQGCQDWEAYLADPGAYNTASVPQDVVVSAIRRSVEALGSLEHQFFADSLGAKEAWRAWPDFRSRCVYLDIETDGGMEGDSVTVIGMYDGEKFTALTKGEDLENFRDTISHFGMIVTFFGTGFDLPMLHRAFPGLVFDQIHLDLCFALKRTGLRGGLKRIEKELGIARTEDTDGLSGLDAIRLWREWLKGDSGSLHRLIEYNRQDVVNLEALAGIAYDRLRSMALGGNQPDSPTPAPMSLRRGKNLRYR